MAKKVQPDKALPSKGKAVKKEAPAKKAAPTPAKAKSAVKQMVPSMKAVPVKTGKKEIVVTAKASIKKIEPAKEIKSSMPRKPVKESKVLVPVKEAQKIIFSKEETRATLLKRRGDLMKEIIENRERESDSLKKDIGDIYDEASSERERELSLTLGDRDRQKLVEIDEALQRLESDDYGICESCGEKIAHARLKAQPFARLCINCKSEEERQEARQKKFEAEGVYRSINYTEEEEG